MIPIADLQRTAEVLIAKAAIEIPDDNIGGLAQAIRLLGVEDFCPFLVESDLKGNGLFD